MAVTGTVLAIAGTGYSIYSQQQAAKQQKKARRAQQRQQQLQARRSQIQSAREAQIAAARQRAAAGALGGLETSGVLGGRAAIGSQLGAGLGFATEMSGLSRNISMFQQKAANAIGRAGIGQSVAGLGGSIYSSSGGFNFGGGNQGTNIPSISTASSGYQPPQGNLPSWAL